MYQTLDVAIRFRERIYGGLPQTKKLIDSYLEAKFGPPTDDFADKLAEQVGSNDFVEEGERVTTAFKRDEKGLYISDYQVKAMLKQAASLLKITTQVRGSKQIFKEGLYVKPERIHLGRMEPDGYEEFCGHVQTPVGKRSVLRRAPYVTQAEVAFTVWVLDVHTITIQHVFDAFTLGQELGLGSCRSFEAGKFDLTKFIEHKEDGSEKDYLKEQAKKDAKNAA